MAHYWLFEREPLLWRGNNAIEAEKPAWRERLARMPARHQSDESGTMNENCD
jgi:hypothetical protein